MICPKAVISSRKSQVLVCELWDLDPGMGLQKDDFLGRSVLPLFVSVTTRSAIWFLFCVNLGHGSYYQQLVSHFHCACKFHIINCNWYMLNLKPARHDITIRITSWLFHIRFGLWHGDNKTHFIPIPNYKIWVMFFIR